MMEKNLPRSVYCMGIAFFALIASSFAAESTVTGTESIPEPAIPRVAAPEKQAASTDAMIWRFIGPMTGTRGSVVIGHPTDKNVFYHGASGGLWKTPDAGLTWVPVGDGQFRSSSVGAMDISGTNPFIMYVGMGEPTWPPTATLSDPIRKEEYFEPGTAVNHGKRFFTKAKQPAQSI